MTMLVALTFAVWLWLYVTRLGLMHRQKVDPDTLKDPVEKLRVMAPVSGPSDNFRNLFEMPVLFYLLCITLMITGRVDAMFVNMAWAYVALRTIHSLIHCSYNKVVHRFGAYLLSSLLLIGMWVRFVLG